MSSYKPLDYDNHNTVDIELTAISDTIHKRPVDSDDGGTTDEDTVELISNEVYDDYEEVLKVVGFGLAHILLLLGTGVALSSDAVEVLSISFAKPIIRKSSELNITNWQNGLLSSIIFFGMLIGGYSWGGIADITGRRLTLITSLSINGLFGAMSAFSPNFYVLLTFRFLSGIGVGGSLPVIVAYNSELIQTKYRGPYLGALGSFWMLGVLLCGGFAWVLLPLELSLSIGSYNIHSWRIYILVSSIPSIIGAILFVIMPESPRFLLEVGKEHKAIAILKKMYNLNNIHKRHSNSPLVFPVKSIKLSHLVSVQQTSNNDSYPVISYRQRVLNIYNNFQEILRRTVSLFYRRLLRSTLILMVVFFCLSFGSYGVTLWYPTYIDRLSKESLESTIEHKDCNNTVIDYTTNIIDSSNNQLFCACPYTNYSNVTFDDIILSSWWSMNVTLTNVTVNGGRYDDMWYNDVVMDTVCYNGVSFYNGHFVNTTWRDIEFVNVTFNNTNFCNINTQNISFTATTFINSTLNNNISLDILSIDNLTMLFNSHLLTSCDQWIAPSTNCITPQDEVDLKQEYFYDFLIASSAFPGNIISAIVVYFFRRSYWLGFSLLLSTVTVILLFFVRTQVFAVLVLCLFKAITIPGWNVTSLLVAEIYPTSLRTTANGVLLLFARIGAIIGSYVFGAFSNTNLISIPILLTAAVLLVSSVVSVFLPKTNRKTPLL